MTRRILASRWWAVITALIAVLLLSPAINSGLTLDDFWQWEILSGHLENAHPGTPLGLFTFFDGNPQRLHDFILQGFAPWWSAENLRLSFWRPLTELTHWIDYQLWPQSPALMHIHSIAWFVVVILLLNAWWRSVDEHPVRANLATLIFGVSSFHAGTVAWLANRNALIAASLSLLSLIAYQYACRYRSDAGRRPTLMYFLSCLLFALALLASEAGLATCAYLFAYAVLLDRQPRWTSRLLRLLPFFFVVVLWKITYSLFGYGSQGAGIYIDPATQPLRFLAAAAERMPMLLMAQLYGISSSIYGWLHSQPGYLAGCAVLLGLFLLALRGVGQLRNPVAQFYALGMLLALVPVCAAHPNDRLLVFAGFGGAGLISVYLHAAFANWSQRSRGHWLTKIFSCFLIFVHLVVLPALFPFNLKMMKVFSEAMVNAPAITLPGDQLGADNSVVLVNPPSVAFVAIMGIVRRYFDLPVPGHILSLAPGSLDLILEVIDDDTLQITARDGFVVDAFNVYRDKRLPFHRGDHVNLDILSATVMELTDEQMPKVVRFRFAGSLADARLRFYRWQDDRYQHFELPIAHNPMILSAFNLYGKKP